MPPTAEHLARLTLTIDRLLDAELLLPADAASLRADADSARQRLEEGDTDAAWVYLDRLADTAAALVRVGLLDRPSGNALVQMVRELADADAA